MESLKKNSDNRNSIGNKLVISNSKKLYVLNIEDIEYLEAQQCYTIVNTYNANKLISSKSLKYYEELLKNTSFYRVHNKYIVNFKHIKEVEGGVPIRLLLTSSSVIPVSRYKKSEIIKIIMNNLNQ